MKYDVIFLDWYKTVSDSLFWDGLIEKPKLEMIQATLFDNNSELANEWMRGVLTAEEAVEAICGKTDLGYSKVFNNLVSSSKQMVLNDIGLLAEVSKLRAKGIKVMIATDNMDTFPRWTVPALKINDYFDGVIDSHTQKALKADFDGETSLFFNDYLQTNKASPEKMILIDDKADAVAVNKQASTSVYLIEKLATARIDR